MSIIGIGKLALIIIHSFPRLCRKMRFLFRTYKRGEKPSPFISSYFSRKKILTSARQGLQFDIRLAIKMIEVVLNDRLGKKVRVKCNDDDTIGDLKKLVAAQTGTRAEKIRIQKWYTIYKDHITLKDYEIHDGMGLELYYN